MSADTDNPLTIVDCPTCKNRVPLLAKSTNWPFCSERCRLVDLGEWLSENRRLILGDEDPGATID